MHQLHLLLANHFHVIVDPFVKGLPILLLRVLLSIEEPSNYLGVFELNFGFFIFRAFDLD